MKMRKRLFVLVGLTLTLAGTIAVRTSRVQAAEADEKLRRAVDTIRLINTAENQLRFSGAKYAPFGDSPLVNACKEAAKKNSEQFGAVIHNLDLQNAKEPLNGFNFSMVVASDGKAYKISLAEKANCGTAFFSDDGGLIYQGKAIDCANK